MRATGRSTQGNHKGTQNQRTAGQTTSSPSARRIFRLRLPKFVWQHSPHRARGVSQDLVAAGGRHRMLLATVFEWVLYSAPRSDSSSLMSQSGRQSLNTSNVLSVIMGGGQGTRLFPLTKERAKPAVPLAGKDRLEGIPISNCIQSGPRRIYLLNQIKSASFHPHISQSYKFV